VRRLDAEHRLDAARHPSAVRHRDAVPRQSAARCRDAGRRRLPADSAGRCPAVRRGAARLYGARLDAGLTRVRRHRRCQRRSLPGARPEPAPDVRARPEPRMPLPPRGPARLHREPAARDAVPGADLAWHRGLAPARPAPFRPVRRCRIPGCRLKTAGRCQAGGPDDHHVTRRLRCPGRRDRDGPGRRIPSRRRRRR
jgi:hypothetical protein